MEISQSTLPNRDRVSTTAPVEDLSTEDIPPSLLKNLKIETDSDDDDVVLSGDNYDDYEYITDSDDEDEEIDQMSQTFSSQYYASEGFDINFRDFKYFFGCLPVPWKKQGLACQWPELTGGELMKKLTCFALDEHNLKEGKKLKLVKLVKANWQPCTGMNYFITCVVKDRSDGMLKTYQVQVQNFREEIIVHKVREKST